MPFRNEKDRRYPPVVAFSAVSDMAVP